MSNYTTQLRFICESLAGLEESSENINSVINTARPLIFNFEYPIFDSEHKSELETKILKHFYFQEIGFETYGKWHSRLDARMNEIMPQYNLLYAAVDQNYSPLIDENITKTYTKTGSGNANSTGSETYTAGGTDSVSTSGDITNAESGTTTTVGSGQDATTTDGTIKRTANLTDATSTTSAKYGSSDTDTDTTKSDTSKYNDTPQGGITGLEAGTYLTNATIVDSSVDDDVHVSYAENINNSDSITHTGTDTTDDDTTVTIDYGKTDTVTHGKSTTTSYEDYSVDTAYGKTENRTNTNGEITSSSETYSETVKGFTGKALFEKIVEFSEKISDVDRLIIENLESLFMGVW